VYSEGVDSILDVTARPRYDVNLQDFYDDFYVEMVRLNDVLRQIGGVLLHVRRSTNQHPCHTRFFQVGIQTNDWKMHFASSLAPRTVLRNLRSTVERYWRFLSASSRIKVPGLVRQSRSVPIHHSQ